MWNLKCGGPDGDERAVAYDPAGYAIVCGLKPGVLPYVEKNAEDIYREEEYCASCWTHDIGVLVMASGLDATSLAESDVTSASGVNMGFAQKWSEKMRYTESPSKLNCRAALIGSIGLER
jgi:hypothetical protein